MKNLEIEVNFIEKRNGFHVFKYRDNYNDEKIIKIPLTWNMSEKDVKEFIDNEEENSNQKKLEL